MQNTKNKKKDDVAKFYSYGCYKSNAWLNKLAKKCGCMAGDGITIDRGIISIDEDYVTTLIQNETIQNETIIEWINNNVITEKDVDSYILEVESETNYGMAKAMGVE